MGSGSLWYTSGREVARGFSTLVAFQCDQPVRKPSNRRSGGTETAVVSREQEGGGAEGSVSFVLHNHRSALSGEWTGGSRGGAVSAVPNSLSVRLRVDSDGGVEISLRCVRRTATGCCRSVGETRCTVYYKVHVFVSVS